MADTTVVQSLNTVLADAIVFYQKLHQYHWVVTGKQFFALHTKLEELYDAWADIVDEVAERILTVGGTPVPTLAAALQQATISEDATRPDAKDMVKTVMADMEAQAANMGKVIEAAEATGDRGSANLMDGYRDQIEKTCWMLRAFLA
jgi:starvation-inducible DNA-binding protein